VNAKAQLRRRRKERKREIHLSYYGPLSRRARCFWTWPLGHEYENGKCVGCGRIEPIGYP